MREVSTGLLTRDEVREFTRVRTWKWLGAAAVEWAIIAAVVAAVVAIGSWWVYIPAVLVIGSRQHALGVLAHDGSHHLVSRNKVVNDLLSDLFAAYPLGFTTAGFRSTHLKHHAFLETDRDPSKVTIERFPDDWTFPMSRRGLARLVARDLSGLSQAESGTLLKYLWEIPGGRAPHIIRLLAYHVAIVVAAVVSGLIWLYLLLWVLPLFTVAIAFYRIRAIAEHSGLDTHAVRYLDDHADPLSATRTTVPRSRLAGFVMAPYHISYHIEHHLYPAVPVFELRRLHRQLQEHPTYTAQAHVTSGHGGLIRELTGASRGS